MTRRKRSLSPVSPRKRVSFEIPASLHQLSALSRSLAKQADSISTPDRTDSNSIVVASQTQILTRHPSETWSPPRHSSPGNKTAPPIKFVPQAQSFPLSQPWPQPQPRNVSPVPIDHYALYRRQQDTTKQSETYRRPSSTILPQPGQAQSEKVAPQNHEAAAGPGETLSLARHPGQIAALIAKKRAENEANRNRERWARAQSEHLAKAGVPPSITSSTDGHSQVGSPSHSRNVSGSSIGVSQSAQASGHTPVLLGTSVRLKDGMHHNRSVADSIGGARMHSFQPNGDIEALFTTPLTSPRQHDRGLDVASDQSTRLQHMMKKDGPHQVPSPTVALPSQLDTQRSQPSKSISKSHSTSKSLSSADMIPIPPLFSDVPRSKQSTAQQPRSVQQGISRSQSNPIFTPPIMSTPQLNHQPRSTPQSYQIQQQQSPQPTQQPQFSNTNMSGYYKINTQLWGVPNNPNMPMSSQSSTYPQPMPVLASNNPSAYYSSDRNEMNLYQNMAPTETNYANFQGGKTADGSYRNSTSGSYGLPKR